ncbi:MAG: hypothetical protein Q9164_000579 [Protoblastenia rupestris]
MHVLPSPINFLPLLITLSTLLIRTTAQIQSASFTWYSGCPESHLPACGPTAKTVVDGKTGLAATNRLNYEAGSPPTNGIGQGCGTCWHIQPQSNPFPSNGNTFGTPVVVKISDECADGGYCDQVRDAAGTLTPNTRYQKELHFDLCTVSGVAEKFFGDIEKFGVLLGVARQVDCKELTNGEYGSGLGMVDGSAAAANGSDVVVGAGAPAVAPASVPAATPSIGGSGSDTGAASPPAGTLPNGDGGNGAASSAPPAAIPSSDSSGGGSETGAASPPAGTLPNGDGGSGAVASALPTAIPSIGGSGSDTGASSPPTAIPSSDSGVGGSDYGAASPPAGTLPNGDNGNGAASSAPPAAIPSSNSGGGGSDTGASPPVVQNESSSSSSSSTAPPASSQTTTPMEQSSGGDTAGLGGQENNADPGASSDVSLGGPGLDGSVSDGSDSGSGSGSNLFINPELGAGLGVRPIQVNGGATGVQPVINQALEMPSQDPAVHEGRSEKGADDNGQECEL